VEVGFATDVTRGSSLSPLSFLSPRKDFSSQSLWNQGNVRVQALAKKIFHFAKTYFSVLQHIVLNLNLVKKQTSQKFKMLRIG
jgi:hypothetical protein